MWPATRYVFSAFLGERLRLGRWLATLPRQDCCAETSAHPPTSRELGTTIGRHLSTDCPAPYTRLTNIFTLGATFKLSASEFSIRLAPSVFPSGISRG